MVNVLYMQMNFGKGTKVSCTNKCKTIATMCKDININKKTTTTRQANKKQCKNHNTKQFAIKQKTN